MDYDKLPPRFIAILGEFDYWAKNHIDEVQKSIVEAIDRNEILFDMAEKIAHLASAHDWLIYEFAERTRSAGWESVAPELSLDGQIEFASMTHYIGVNSFTYMQHLNDSMPRLEHYWTDIQNAHDEPRATGQEVKATTLEVLIHDQHNYTTIQNITNVENNATEFHTHNHMATPNPDDQTANDIDEPTGQQDETPEPLVYDPANHSLTWTRPNGETIYDVLNSAEETAFKILLEQWRKGEPDVSKELLEKATGKTDHANVWRKRDKETKKLEPSPFWHTLIRQRKQCSYRLDPLEKMLPYRLRKK